MPNNTEIKITVITVSYNAVSTIENTIKSVINQSYSNIEYIIIDGGSTDGTTDIIKKYSEKIAYWKSEPDEGIYNAMNKGIIYAKGDYIHFLNSSDIFYTEDTIQTVVNSIPSNIPDVIYGNIIIEKKDEYIYMRPNPLYDFIYNFPIFHPSCFVKTSLMKKNKFDESFKIAADWNFLRKIYYKGASFYYVPLIFTIFEGINGISSCQSEIRNIEINRIRNIKYLCSIKYIKDFINYKIRNRFNKWKGKKHSDHRILKIQQKKEYDT